VSVACLVLWEEVATMSGVRKTKTKWKKKTKKRAKASTYITKNTHVLYPLKRNQHRSNPNLRKYMMMTSASGGGGVININNTTGVESKRNKTSLPMHVPQAPIRFVSSTSTTLTADGGTLSLLDRAAASNPYAPVQAIILKTLKTDAASDVVPQTPTKVSSSSDPSNTKVSSSDPSDIKVSSSNTSDTKVSSSDPSETKVSSSDPSDTKVSSSSDPSDTKVSSSNPSDTKVSSSSDPSASTTSILGAATGGSTFMQCSKCRKWRIVMQTQGIFSQKNGWDCSMNPDPKQNTCSAPEITPQAKVVDRDDCRKGPVYIA